MPSILILRSHFSELHHHADRQTLLYHTIRHTHTFGHKETDIKNTHTELDTNLDIHDLKI